MQSSAIEHNSQDVRYRYPLGAAAAKSHVRLAIRLNFDEAVAKVKLRLWCDSTGEKLVEMKAEESPAEGAKIYTAVVDMPAKGCLIWYYFIISAYTQTIYYGNNSAHVGGVGACYDHVPPSFQITVYDSGAKTPDWFKKSVMYQIFPDRFYRQEKLVPAKKGAVLHTDWSDMPCYYKDPDTKEIVAYDFFGGNLAGIREKLSYLQKLGITVIYFNPVFESESNHHYDTGDYHKIDPILGTNEEFADLCREAKEKYGIRIIIDGVFSHTGSNSKYFNRKGQYDTVGAYQSDLSPYYEWYRFTDYPHSYESWWGFDTLPNVNETNPSYLDYIIRDKDSVLHHWLQAGVSGWRLDVVDELPAEFTQAFFAEMKKIDPESVLIGEVWEDASNKVSYGVPREYLCGHEIDSAMNYPLRKMLLDFFLGQIDAACLNRQLLSLRENYPAENFYAMMNLLGSHDVERLITVLGEAPLMNNLPAVRLAEYKLPEAKYELGRQRVKMAALFQLTFPGVPCIYYGDEIGMQGFRDPYNRAPYNWQNGDEELRSWYQKLIALRNAHPALSTGEYVTLYSKDDVFVFGRYVKGGCDVFEHQAQNEMYLTVINRSQKEQHAEFYLGDLTQNDFADVFAPENKLSNCDGRVLLELPPMTGRIYQQQEKKRKYQRVAGILLHPSSLPSKYGIGDFGKTAYDFVDFLAAAGQKVWQILPLNPVGFGYSPYQSSSAFAGNPLFISLDELMEKKLLRPQDVKIAFADKGSEVAYEYVDNYKYKSLRKAYSNFLKRLGAAGSYEAFCHQQAFWLDDYALFRVLKKEYQGAPWYEWPEEIRSRHSETMLRLKQRYAAEMGFIKFVQYLFSAQWHKLHRYAREKGIKIIGDMPLFLSGDSADVWAHQDLFDLLPDGTPRSVAGVPPDYFSKTGQLWGNPQYNWLMMEEQDFHWWKERIRRLLEQVDIVRIDHFRGLEAYWKIPGRARTAMDGQWVKGPGEKFFLSLQREFGSLPFVAEDLGVITESVVKLREKFAFPGMHVLHFSLGQNEAGRIGSLPAENMIAYTGTHDNNTTIGWYQEDLSGSEKTAVASFLGVKPEYANEICQRLIEHAYESAARAVIVPMQDILALGSRHRMNKPGTVESNWKWRMQQGMLKPELSQRLQKLCQKYQR